jgi:hypothetical protein
MKCERSEVGEANLRDILNLIEPSENEITEIVALFYYHLNFTFNVMVALEIIPYINNFFEI